MNHTTELNWKKYIVTENIKFGIESLSQLFRDQTVKATLKKVIEIKTDEKSQTDFSTPIIARKKGQSYVFAGHPPTFAQRVVARMTLLLL